MIPMLLRYRLHWYAISTGRLVLRRWQALLLTLAVLAPASVPLLKQAESLGWPVLALLSPEHGAAWRLAALCLYQSLAVIWLLMQRDQVAGGDFSHYVRSLPVPPRQARAVELVVLLVANSPLLLVPVAALAWLCARDNALALLLHGLFIAHLLLLAMAAQLACLDRAYARLSAIAFANIPLAIAPGTSPAVQPALFAATLPCAWLAARCLSAPPVQRALRSCRRRASAMVSRAAPARLHPAAFIPLHCLVRQAPMETLGKLAVAAAATTAALALMAIWNHDDRCAGLAVITLAIVAVAISGLYRDLAMAHRAALPLVAGLPLPAGWARRFDHATLMLAGMPFAAAIGGVVAFHQPHRLVSMLLLGAAFLGLVGVLRLPQVHAGRQTVVLSASTAALWGTVAAATLLPD